MSPHTTTQPSIPMDPTHRSSGAPHPIRRWVTGALLILFLLPMSVATAGPPASSGSERFLTEALEVTALFAELAEIDGDPRLAAQVNRLTDRILRLDAKQLPPWPDAATENAAWEATLQELRGHVEAARDADAWVGAEALTEGDTTPQYSSHCGDDRPSIASELASLLFAEIFEGLAIIGQSACDAAPSGDIEQANLLACPPAGVLAEASLIAQSVYDNEVLCSGDIDSVEISATYQLADDMDELLEDNLDTQVTTRASQDSVDDLTTEVQTVESTLSVVQSDVDGLETSVAALQAELDDVQTRVTDTQLGVDDLETRVSDIELSLDDLRLEVQALADTTDALSVAVAEHADSTESFEALNLQILIEADLERNRGAVSLFQLPFAVGGYLELAREIVVDTIDANRAAGQDVGQAQDTVYEGDALFDAGAYRDAYGSYREAYHQATGQLDR